MSSSISINTYLWIHTWQRWRERPGAPLARALVVCILTGLAVGVLSAYLLSEADLGRRLEQQGINTLVLRWREPAAHDGGRGMLGSRFRTLYDHGVVFPVTVLAVRVRVDLNGQYAPTAWIGQTHWHDAFEGPHPEGVAWGGEELAPGITVRATDRPWGTKITSAHMRAPLRSMLGENALLSQDPYPLTPEPIAETALVFTRSEGAPAMEEIVEALRIMANLDGLDKLDLHGPNMLLEQLRELQDAHSSLRLGLGALMGMSITVVFGALATLEYSETRQVFGLLRSLGAAPRTILWQKYVVDTLLANGCFALALGIWSVLAMPLFVGLGFAPDLVRSATELWSSPDMLILLGCLNLGVGCSLMPMLRAIFLPIGRALG